MEDPLEVAEAIAFLVFAFVVSAVTGIFAGALVYGALSVIEGVLFK